MSNCISCGRYTRGYRRCYSCYKKHKRPVRKTSTSPWFSSSKPSIMGTRGGRRKKRTDLVSRGKPGLLDSPKRRRKKKDNPGFFGGIVGLAIDFIAGTQKKSTKYEPTVSQTEVALKKELEKLGLKPKVQHRVGKMVVDFAFPKERVVIEVDGPHHFSRSQQRKDRGRDEFASLKGWETLRYKATEVWEDTKGIAWDIKKEIIKRQQERERER